MDPETIKGIAMWLGLAESLIGSDVIPGLKKFFGDHFEMTPEDLADLDAGFAELAVVRQKLQARRAEIAGGGE